LCTLVHDWYRSTGVVQRYTNGTGIQRHSITKHVQEYYSGAGVVQDYMGPEVVQGYRCTGIVLA
jgi:hypothetical protein